MTTLPIPDSELTERFVRSSGPGGQNVNKVATAVELRFDVWASPSLSHAVKTRLARIAGRRMGADGVLMIRAERFRTQDMNRQDARERLAEMIAEASVEPKRRVKTKPSRAAKQRRTDEKVKRGRTKQMRRSRDFD